eukprot:2486033-Amphidinium_carterae.1
MTVMIAKPPNAMPASDDNASLAIAYHKMCRYPCKDVVVLIVCKTAPVAHHRLLLSATSAPMQEQQARVVL